MFKHQLRSRKMCRNDLYERVRKKEKWMERKTVKKHKMPLVSHLQRQSGPFWHSIQLAKYYDGTVLKVLKRSKGIEPQLLLLTWTVHHSSMIRKMALLAVDF